MNQMHGIQTVREALRLETYPMDRSAIYYAVGDIVLYDANRAEVPVRDLLDRSPRSEFWSADEVIAEIERCMIDRMESRPRRELRAARALGWLSIGIGVAQLLAPRMLARTSGLGRRRRLVELFGIREIITGIGLLTQPRKAPWLWARTAGDVLDLMAIGHGSGSRFSRSAAATVVGLIALTDLTTAIKYQNALASAAQ